MKTKTYKSGIKLVTHLAGVLFILFVLSSCQEKDTCLNCTQTIHNEAGTLLSTGDTIICGFKEGDYPVVETEIVFTDSVWYYRLECK